MTTAAEADGRIVTFYSYKGGTGRSMALANVAWILASNGYRVLVIDWDLEAPGLHRYFHPFLEDKELSESPGLIDYVVEFSEAARHAKRTEGTDQTAWYERYTSLLRYTYSLEWNFGESTIDFVPAGQQGPAYALRVNGFNWQEFYEKLGGGVLFEAVKKRLREEYDYVLIDSRTGISDTSGICTVQMPDDLVVCFTLNEQSIKGAAAVAESADLQRRRVTNEPSLRIWPVPTRVELAEKDRLDAARELARRTFQRYLGHLTRVDRRAYWSAVEILYQPYFAYEEVLAVFAERRRQKASMLSSLESLTQYLTVGRVTELATMNERDRLRGYESFKRTLPTPAPTDRAGGRRPGAIFISFSYDDMEWVDPIASRMISRFGDAVWYDRTSLLPGDDWADVIKRAQTAADIAIAFFGPGWSRKNRAATFERQLVSLLASGKRLVPIMIGGLPIGTWIKKVESMGEVAPLIRSQASVIAPDAVDTDTARICDILERLLTMVTPNPQRDPEDPQKGQWGGKARTDSRILSAQVRELSSAWFDVALTVTGTAEKPLEGLVEFHLHPTFTNAVERVDVHDGRATLNLKAWGAFTVGAVADDGRTALELDLSEDSSFPEVFRSR